MSKELIDKIEETKKTILSDLENKMIDNMKKYGVTEVVLRDIQTHNGMGARGYLLKKVVICNDKLTILTGTDRLNLTTLYNYDRSACKDLVTRVCDYKGPSKLDDFLTKRKELAEYYRLKLHRHMLNNKIECIDNDINISFRTVGGHPNISKIECKFGKVSLYTDYISLDSIGLKELFYLDIEAFEKVKDLILSRGNK